MILEDKKNRLELKRFNKNYKAITEKDILKLVEEMSKIPLFKDSSVSFDKMKRQLKNTILGQDNAIDLICDSFRKNKSMI